MEPYIYTYMLTKKKKRKKNCSVDIWMVFLRCCLFLLRPHQIAETVNNTTKTPTVDATIAIIAIFFCLFLQETGEIRSSFPHTLHIFDNLYELCSSLAPKKKKKMKLSWW